MSGPREPAVPKNAGLDLRAMGAHWWNRLRSRPPVTVRLLRDARIEAQRSRLPQMAAALSYRTIFGLIPVMVVALIALKFFTTEADLTDAINKAMQYSGLSQIAVSNAQESTRPFPEEAPFEPAASATPDSAQRLDQWIKQLVSRVSHFDVRAVGIIGVVALLYAAISMLVEVERAFNQILCVPIGRSWMRRVLNYWFLLTVGPAALFATFFIGQRFTAEIAQWAGDRTMGKVVLALVGYLSTTSISTVMFVALYLVIPNTRVKFGPAIVGGFVGAMLWEAGKWGFTEYLRYSAGYAKLYGTIALVPLFLLWVYVTWCIVLAGLNITYYLQYGRRAEVARPAEQINPGVVEPGSAIGVVAALARRFEKGSPADTASLAHMVNLQQGIVQQMLDRLVGAGIALRVKHKDEDGFFALARPADRISALEVLSVSEDLIAQPAEGSIGAAMREARRGVVAGKSVADFLGDPPPGPPPASAPAPAQITSPITAKPGIPGPARA